MFNALSPARRTAFAFAVLLPCVVRPARAETVYGITYTSEVAPQTLVRFDSATPGAVVTVAPLTGMAPGQLALAIDFRPATGQLYLGAGATTEGGAAQLYTVNLGTGGLTAVGLGFDPTGYGYPSFDFDPVRDELRVVTTVDGVASPVTNTRFHPVTGALIANETNMAFRADDPNAGTNPPDMVGAAYSNNVAGAKSATLYGYELETDHLVTIGGIGGSPSADGGLLHSVGHSGYAVPNSLDVGFDISGPTGVAYLSSVVDGLDGFRLFTVNLTSGAMTDVGALGTPPGTSVIDIAATVPEPTALGFILAAVSIVCSRRRARGRVPANAGVDPLEARTLFASFTATSAADLIADINAANATPAADTITLAAGATFQLTKVNNTTSGPTGLPVIRGVLTIVGNGRTIERFVPPAPPSTGGIPPATTPAFRLFDVPAGASLTLTNLTLRGGRAVTATPASSSIYVALPARGGAVHSLGALNLQGVTVYDNAAVGRRGVSTWGSSGAGSDAAGGGVYSAGSLMITGSTLRNNSATGGAGLNGFAFGTDWSYFHAGHGGHGFGGGLYVAGGTAMVTGSKVEANSARGGYGGVGRAGGRGGSGSGGGVFAADGIITLRTTTVTANAATGGTGTPLSVGTGRLVPLPALAGKGIGGAAYVQAPAVVRMDAFSKTHLTGNTASTSSKDLFGPFTAIV